jgi:hypothetical protein
VLEPYVEQVADRDPSATTPQTVTATMARNRVGPTASDAEPDSTNRVDWYAACRTPKTGYLEQHTVQSDQRGHSGPDKRLTPGILDMVRCPAAGVLPTGAPAKATTAAARSRSTTS